MSALGQKRTSAHVRVMSALPPKADIAGRDRDVRFCAKSAHSTFDVRRDLLAGQARDCAGIERDCERTLDEGRSLRTCVQRQRLIPARVPASAWDVFPAIDLSWHELVALPLRDARSKTSQTIRRPPDE